MGRRRRAKRPHGWRDRPCWPDRAGLYLAGADVLLPLSAMLYFSFLTVAPIGGRVAELTLEHYAALPRQGLLPRSRLALAPARLRRDACLPADRLSGGAGAGQNVSRDAGARRSSCWSSCRSGASAGAHLLLDDGAARRRHPRQRIQACLSRRAEPLDLLFTYPAIVIGLVHAYLPYMILTCYISLQAIDDALIEAARSLGASGAQLFRARRAAAQPARPARRRAADLRAGDRLLHGAAHPGRHEAASCSAP